MLECFLLPFAVQWNLLGLDWALLSPKNERLDSERVYFVAIFPLKGLDYCRYGLKKWGIALNVRVTALFATKTLHFFDKLTKLIAVRGMLCCASKR